MKPRILFIDAYDSFSNNIVALLEIKLDVEVILLHIDAIVPELTTFLKSFIAVVVGPGPGNPRYDKDVGLMNELWRLQDDDMLPVLGICLGFQSLVLAFGGSVEPLPEPRHGIETIITLNQDSIFNGIKHIVAVQYHSLHGTLGHYIPKSPLVASIALHLWSPSKSCPDLRPLAWDFNGSDAPGKTHRTAPKNPSCILMAVKHTTKPFYGIQFHPESICSSVNCQEIVIKWWTAAKDWRRGHNHLRPKLDTQLNAATANDIFLPSLHKTTIHEECIMLDGAVTSSSASSNHMSNQAYLSTPDLEAPIESKILPIGQLTIPAICEILGMPIRDIIILDSETHQMRDIGSHSIVGIITQDTPKIEYFTGSRTVSTLVGDEKITHSLESHDNSIFNYLKAYMEDRKVNGHHTGIPFWGGLMGYITYEACLETIDIHTTNESRTNKPGLSFAFIERSIVIDHENRTVHIQSIKEYDFDWVSETYETLANYSFLGEQEIPEQHDQIRSYLSSADIQYPTESSYKAKIRACQTFIRSGDSYEMCLTNQAMIRAESTGDSPTWPLYLRLRVMNSAPFSAYVRLGPLTLLSTSPERFMSWTRPSADTTTELSSICQFRPIKGTVKKKQCHSATGETYAITLEEASALLATAKERAENLMIVDLIRHDLHGVVGPGNVIAKDLMVVEEYTDVFQLVSVIEGTLMTSTSPFLASSAEYDELVDALRNIPHKRYKKDPKSIRKLGIDVLASSLPPGSMTGAPKRRSCQLLRSIEKRRPRSVYSGVVGYMDVGGGGDFSVVIRSIFKWDNDQQGSHQNSTQSPPAENKHSTESQVRSGSTETNSQKAQCKAKDEWIIGAGGAVTVLSTEGGEWEEMQTKLASTLQLFAGQK